MAVIIVHGGAGAWPEERRPQASEGCVLAAQAGHSVLLQSGSALDAVEQAVVLLEDEPIFNAGRGSHFNKAGHVEMDALICDGAIGIDRDGAFAACWNTAFMPWAAIGTDGALTSNAAHGVCRSAPGAVCLRSRCAASLAWTHWVPAFAGMTNTRK